MTAAQLDFLALGKAARESAQDAHGDDLPGARVAYGFLLDNPECFMERGPSMGAPELERDVECEWPAGMPQNPPLAFIGAYYGAVRGSHASDCAVWAHENCDCVVGKDSL